MNIIEALKELDICLRYEGKTMYYDYFNKEWVVAKDNNGRIVKELYRSSEEELAVKKLLEHRE
jgi:hypothetical protein